MGDTGSEPPPLPRCRCGFWGSSETMNLCSKCFTDFQNKQPDDDRSLKPSSSCDSELSDGCRTSMSPHPKPSSRSPSQPTGPSQKGASVENKPSSLSGDELSPAKRPRLEDHLSGEVQRSKPKQRNRRRCYQCSSKLELVQAELGSCRCGFVFCVHHRLPEQHQCDFDHLGRGREDAVRRMVKLDRKVGRSCQRIGEECS